MDEQRAAALGEIATEAGVERASFLTDAAGQFTKFLEDNAERLRSLGGLVLIDDEPEYLEVTAEGTFRSRTRYQDDDGEWVSETEEIESGGELVEIYNPADLYAAFADAARDEAGLERQPTAAEDLLETAGIASEAGVEQERDDEDDAVERAAVRTPTDKEEAARLLYDLALTFQERSQDSQAQVLDSFEYASEKAAAMLGDSMIIDEEDERLWFRASGAFEAEVVPGGDEETEGEPEWQSLTSSDDVVQYYDPTDLFGDLAEAIAEKYPDVAPELDEDAGDEAPKE